MSLQKQSEHRQEYIRNKKRNVDGQTVAETEFFANLSHRQDHRLSYEHYKSADGTVSDGEKAEHHTNEHAKLDKSDDQAYS